MRIKHHYCYEDNARMRLFLEKYNIAYELSDYMDTTRKLCTFDLYEDQEEYVKFKRRFFISEFGSLKSIEYSKKEIEDAEWLTIRSMTQKLQWDYDGYTFQKTCPYKKLLNKDVYYRHLNQVGTMYSHNTIKWGNRQFFCGPNSAEDFLFCSERTRSLLENKWDGLCFWPVKKYNNKKEASDLWQVIFDNILPMEAISGGKITQCGSCGKRIMRFTGGIYRLEVKGEYLDSKKVYRTDNILNEQLVGGDTFSVNIVPHSFYQYCEENQMNRGIIYEPVKLI